MELDRYYELRTILQQWRARLAESIRQRIEASARRLERLRRMHQAEGTGEEFTLWLDRWCRQAAIQFILRVLFLRVLEDRELLGVTRLRTTDGQQMWAGLTRNLGAAHYVQWCCWDAAHLLPDLFGPTEYDLVLPDDELAQRFLDDVWRRPDPDRPGWLRFDFRPDPARQDEGFQTRFIGDLYQELDAEIRARYALLQTPQFISQFILEHTLLKRFEEKDYHDVTLIDPTCGSGHFLVDAFRHFIDRYEAEALASDGGAKTTQKNTPPAPRPTPALPSAKRAEIARTIIETHLHGCDINPYATALARFRLILAACDYAQPTSLQDFREIQFNLVTIDSLIPYETLMVGGVQVGTDTARLLGQPEAIQRALPVLQKRYDVVVGNPPYINPQDAVKRDLYRESYISAYQKFGLSAPFTERFLKLALDGGFIGLINSNAFARRQFGRKLIEEVLPQYDLQTVVDLSGAYIPGHGTPTLIIFARKQMPIQNTVRVLSNLKGETGTLTDPAKGKVWQSVKMAFTAVREYTDEFVDVADRSRDLLAVHPWQFGGPKSRLYERIADINQTQLDQIASSIGIVMFTLTDEVYIMPEDMARRKGFKHKYLRIIVTGEGVRDWRFSEMPVALFPYETDFTPFVIKEHSAECSYLSQYRDALANTLLFGGKTKVEGGLKWFEYGRLTYSKLQTPQKIVFSEIVSHNHFVLEEKQKLYQRTAPVIKLDNEDSISDHKFLTANLNSSVVCFCLKQVCFNKGAGNDPVRDRYVYAGNYVGMIPLPFDYPTDATNYRRMVALADEMTTETNQLPTLLMSKVFEKTGEAYHAWNAALDGYVPPHPDLPPPFTTARELRAARDNFIALRQDIRSRMIFLQEEMDWLAYQMYGLLKSKAPLAEDYLTPRQYREARLELGQRPFEVAGREYRGDWPKGYRPAPLPEPLRPLTEERMAIIEANPDIALLEDPLYKRRWIPPDYEQEFRDAAGWWLAEKLEYALEQAGRPLSLKEWARRLGRDERVNATLELLTGSPMFDLEQELLKIIRANAVPNRPEHYLKPSGLRKLYAARGTPQVPEYKRGDFSDGTAWKLRGKLNIPRERFIYYEAFDHTQRGVEAPDSGGPWFGWAGWDAPHRADALAYLLDQANRAGWELHYRQCGLRAALRDLLPELGDMPAADRAEFEAIAGLCGIGLDTRCYCRAYRDGLAEDQPGVPGVGDAVLEIKALPSAGKKPAGQSRGKKGEDSAQLRLDL